MPLTNLNELDLLMGRLQVPLDGIGPRLCAKLMGELGTYAEMLIECFPDESSTLGEMRRYHRNEGGPVKLPPDTLKLTRCMDLATRTLPAPCGTRRYRIYYVYEYGLFCMVSDEKEGSATRHKLYKANEVFLRKLLKKEHSRRYNLGTGLVRAMLETLKLTTVTGLERLHEASDALAGQLAQITQLRENLTVS